METSNNIVHFIQLAKTEIPMFKESNGKDWVPAGEDNELFENLIKYSTYSSTHQSILQTKINLVSGDEFVIEKNQELTPNPNEDFNQFLDKLSADLEIIGAYAIEVIWSADRKKIAEMNHIPFQYLRYKKSDSLNKIDGMFFCKNWKDVRKNKPIFIPFFDEKKPGGRQILVVKKYWPGTPYTILPSYYSSLNYIKIDYLISEFHYSNIQNGLNPGLILSFFGREYEDPDKAKKMVQAIEKKYGGTQNVGKLMVLFNRTKDEKVEVEQLQNNDVDKMFSILVENVSQQILTAHQLTNPQLAGIKTPGELGGGGLQLLQSNELFINNVILPDQKLLENGVNKLLKVNGYEGKIINNSVLKFGFSENLLTNILTKTELRELIGYEELEGEMTNE